MVWETNDLDPTPNWSNNVANIKETRGRPDSNEDILWANRIRNDISQSNDNEINNWMLVSG